MLRASETGDGLEAYANLRRFIKEVWDVDGLTFGFGLS